MYADSQYEQLLLLSLILNQKDDLYKTEFYKRKKLNKHTEFYNGISENADMLHKQQYADINFIIANGPYDDSKKLFEELSAYRKQIFN